MKSQSILYGIIGLVVGALVTGAIMSKEDQSISNKTNMHAGSHMSMDDMITGLAGKAGDEFDKAFIAEMIAHHQGAIDMAKEAQINAKHDEIKKLSNDIISAQEKEIAQMKSWQKSWGYAQ